VSIVNKEVRDAKDGGENKGRESILVFGGRNSKALVKEKMKYA